MRRLMIVMVLALVIGGLMPAHAARFKPPAPHAPTAGWSIPYVWQHGKLIAE